jgi:hypothetical protein
LVQIVVLVVLYHKYSHPEARQQQWKWPTKIEQLMHNKVYFWFCTLRHSVLLGAILPVYLSRFSEEV